MWDERGQPSLTLEGALAMRIGMYQIVSRLGVGGSAELFVGRAPADKRQNGAEPALVAIKRLLLGLASDPAIAASFLQEAQLAAMFAHPNVVRTLGSGVDGGGYFIAMELIDGWDLWALLAHAT